MKKNQLSLRNLRTIQDGQTNAKKPETPSASGFGCGRHRSKEEASVACRTMLDSIRLVSPGKGSFAESGTS